MTTLSPCKRAFQADDVSLTLAHGTLNILLGPTLSGKTSLMRLMAGLDRPKLRGVDLHRRGPCPSTHRQQHDLAG